MQYTFIEAEAGYVAGGLFFRNHPRGGRGCLSHDAFQRHLDERLQENPI